MSTKSITTSAGTNYNGGVANSGSHVVGWSSRLVRSEVYSFTTGDLPCSGLSFTLSWQKGDGANIPLRCIISTSQTANVQSHGSTLGSQINTNNTATTITQALEANTTYYITFFPGTDLDVGTWYGWYYCGGSAAFNISLTQIDYTNCSAPTTVQIAASIAAPGKNQTLRWSGARAGTNMSIASYEIWRSTSLNGSYTQYKTGITTTAYSVPAPTTRGSSYYYKIKTVGSVTGYTSALSTKVASLQANRLPTVPIVTYSNVVKAGSNVTFTIVPGADADNQLVSLSYRTSLSSSAPYIPITSPWTMGPVDSATTLYFYSYDGLEYSSPYTASILINTAPVATNIQYTDTDYNVGGSTGVEGYCKGYNDLVNLQLTVNKNCKLNAYVGMKAYTGTGAVVYDNYYLFDTQNCTTGQNSFIFNINDATYLFGDLVQTSDICWNFYFNLSDEVETTTNNYYPTSMSNYYKIAQAPSSMTIYNQHGANANISGTNGDICKKIRCIVPNDESLTKTEIIATDINNIQYRPEVTTTVSGYNRIVEATLAATIPADSDVSIKLILSEGAKQRYVTTTCHKTKVPTLTNFWHGKQTIKPFTDTSSFDISIAWPFGDTTTLSTGLAAYNCGTNAFHFRYATSSAGANLIDKTAITSNWVKEQDSLVATVSSTNAYAFTEPHELGYVSYTGIVEYFCQMAITNLFGETYTTTWLPRYFNFDALALTSIAKIEWAASATATSWTTITDSIPLQEGMYLRFSVKADLYTADPLSIDLFVNNGTSERLVTTVKKAATELTRATNRTRAQNTVQIIYGPVGEITSNATRAWTAAITNNAGTVKSSAKNTGALRHQAPSAALVECAIDANYNFTYKYNILDNGYDGTTGTLEAWLYDGEQNMTAKLASTQGTVQSLTSGWEVKSINVRLRSTVAPTNGIASIKEYVTNYIVVYQVSPTVAYRKNQLGINTSSPTTAAVLDIHQSTNNHIVLLQGRNTSNNEIKVSIDMSSGIIELQENNIVKHTIDLLNGLID